MACAIMSPRMSRSLLIVLVAVLGFASSGVAQSPAPEQHDVVLKNFTFQSGGTLPELRIHYRTLGKPARDRAGIVRNAVLIMHGTGGDGAQFIRPEFSGELFGSGALLDATKYFIILPDGIGHGRSSKPSD